MLFFYSTVINFTIRSRLRSHCVSYIRPIFPIFVELENSDSDWSVFEIAR